MAAIIAATPEGDSDQCPTLGNLVPYFSGEHGTDDDNPYHNAREDNSSHARVFDPSRVGVRRRGERTRVRGMSTPPPPSPLSARVWNSPVTAGRRVA